MEITVYILSPSTINFGNLVRLKSYVIGYGICSNLLKWISDFIQHRLQRIVIIIINGACSMLKVVFLRVQSSDHYCFCYMYLLTCNTFRMILPMSLHGVSDGNYSLMKASLYIFAFPPPTLTVRTLTYKVNDKVIDCKAHHKDLGIFYSYNLTWTEHYDHITTKAYSTLGSLRRTFKTNNVHVKKQLYISLV